MIDRILNVVIVLALAGTIYTGIRPGGWASTRLAAYREQRRLLAKQRDLWPRLSVDGRRIGSVGAPVRAIEFADYECPACRFMSTITDSVAKAAGAAVVFFNRPLPTHALARPAAIASICAADQGKFVEMHSQLMSSRTWLIDSNWVREAQEAGIGDLGTFRVCLGGPAAATRLDHDIAIADSLMVRATPTFITREGRWIGEIPSIDSLR